MKPLLTLFFLLLPLLGSAGDAVQLSDQQAKRIGELIWQNEGAGKVHNLTVWNRGEDFPSLGIGHFIWYPQGVEGPFTESFPLLIDYIRQHREIPEWLREQEHSPWGSRQQFIHDFDGPRLTELRRFLHETIDLQTRFIIQRLEAALPKMLEAAPRSHHGHIKEMFHCMAQSDNGVYALIDYVNFKGEGSSPKERYRGEGWGLLQVLENMDGEAGDCVESFIQSADFVLTRRVANAPREEGQWLPGWRKRLGTYRRLW